MRPKPYLLILILFTFFTSSGYAQQFDWVKGGGTTLDDAYLENHPEATQYMCTEPNGNIYTISTVGNAEVVADTFSSYPYGSDENFVVASYNCSGEMRWAKLIASSSGSCIPYGIVSDTLGHIYLAGYFSNQTLYIGSDTAITDQQYLFNGVIQFDTTGHFNWISYVGDDDLNNAFSTLAYGSTIFMDASARLHFINHMKDGVHIMPGLTSQYGTYDLVYDEGGTLISAARIGLDSEWYITSLTVDNATNKLYVCGERIEQFNPNLIMFTAALDAERNTVWMDTIADEFSYLKSIVYDNMGHLYYNGGANLTSFVFNGDSLPPGQIAVVMKTDTGGRPIWLQSYYNSLSVAGYAPNTLTLLPNNLIVSAGGFAGDLLLDGDTVLSSGNEYQNPYLLVLDTSGVVKSLQQIHGDGFYDLSISITSDKVGNVYIGGQVEDSIWADNGNTSIPAYHSVGGNTDFFIMKYGVDCNCTSMPVANYSDTGTAATRGFTYTGTTNDIDSVVWDFGDGSATVNTMIPVMHTYDSGSYEACVYAYSACGSDMHCSKVNYGYNEGITDIKDLGISVYPNPATDEINITTQASGISYKLMSITGALLQSGILQNGNNKVSLDDIASGIYLLQLRDGNGNVKVTKVIKE